jgi:predicted AlkP superfamily pyrophosphatase or phosphodiesterase
MPPLNRLAALVLILLLGFSRNSQAAQSETVANNTVPPSAYNGHPRLAIILVIDQFREDYLERYRADFKGRGFNLFLEQGTYFPDCYYDYINTKTAPGHSTIGTGAYSDGHGIANNDWWDLSRNTKRPITSVEDERYALVGTPPTSPSTPGSSPRNLRASTVGDELRLATKGEAKLFGISLKDRASILPAGASANGAYWLDAASGNFITSTYYMGQLPAWAAAFNASGRAAQAAQEATVFANAWHLKESSYGGKNFYGFVGSTPAANAYEIDFAKALIVGEQLGHHPVTDMMTLSLSANDILGHAVGPDSPAQRAMVDSIDTDLAGFFDWLDAHVDGGLANVWIALTADHGIAPVTSVAAELGMNAAGINVKALIASINDAMNAKYSPGQKLNYLFDRQELPILSLNQPVFEQAGIKERDAEQAVVDALPAAVDALSAVADETAPPRSRIPAAPLLISGYTKLQLAAGTYPANELGQLLAHSYSSNGGWYVMAIFAGYQMESSSSGGTTHFSPWSYDRHVPLGFYGAPFAPGIYHGRVGPVDLAATWASLLGVNQPSASVGRILTQAIKPGAEITYPSSKSSASATPMGARPFRALRGRVGESDASSSDSPNSPVTKP